jgi:hypothetical protein
LSSRIPYGTQVTTDRLRQIERAEAALRAAGVTGDLRVRYHGELARVELASRALDAWLTESACATIDAAVHGAGFERVSVDLRGFRSGSLNLLGGVVAEPLVRATSASGAGDAVGLSDALCQLDLSCDIEARDRLAILRDVAETAVERLRVEATRQAVTEIGRRYGFTHVAIELARAEATAVNDAAVHRR